MNEKQYQVVNGMTFDARTPAAVANILERLNHAGQRVRLFYGDVGTGRDWCKENDVIGTIGKSFGRYKIPLLILRSNSWGGGPILDHCILKIQDVQTGQVLYQASNYITPTFQVEHMPARYPDLPWSVYRTDDGTLDNVANFETEAAAWNWVAFMRGERFRVR